MYTNIIHNDDICNYFLKNQQFIFNSLGNCRECRLDTTSFRLLGFNVLEQYGAALEKSCWFTEDARDRYEISEQNRTLGREKDGVPEYECCGIISDFRAEDALVTPMEDSHNVVMIRSGICAGMLIKVTGDRKEAFAAVADVWRGMTKEVIGFPTEPDMNYLVDELNSSLTEERNTMTLVSVFMILSILISALGRIYCAMDVQAPESIASLCIDAGM